MIVFEQVTNMTKKNFWRVFFYKHGACHDISSHKGILVIVLDLCHGSIDRRRRLWGKSCPIASLNISPPFSSLFLSCPFLSFPERNRGALFLFCPWWTDAEEQQKSLNSPMLHLIPHIVSLFFLSLGNWTIEIEDQDERLLWSRSLKLFIRWRDNASVIHERALMLSNKSYSNDLDTIIQMASFCLLFIYLSWIVIGNSLFILITLIMAFWFPS